MWVVNVKVCLGTGDMLHQEAKVTRLIIPWNTLFIGEKESVINFIFLKSTYETELHKMTSHFGLLTHRLL